MLPPEFSRIRLELAREEGHPEGDRNIGYEFAAPLDPEGRLMPDLWKKHRDHCRVRRFHEGEDDQIGRLNRRRSGEWYFDYDPDTTADDEAGHRFGDERFVMGEYVSIADDEQRMHTYRVVSIQPV
jgi:hypothetical protein